MLRATAILVLALVCQNAGAHLLDEHQDLSTQLAHQVVGGHHLPITILSLLFGVLTLYLLRLSRNKNK